MNALDDLKKYTLLVVDDEEELRNAMVFDFRRKGFNVLIAENGMKALDIVKKNKVHLVISDMRMAGGSGMEFLEQVRVLDAQMPLVIFVSGYSDYTEEQCIAKGAQKLIHKPFDRKVLMNSVLEALNTVPTV